MRSLEEPAHDRRAGVVGQVTYHHVWRFGRKRSGFEKVRRRYEECVGVDDGEGAYLTRNPSPCEERGGLRTCHRVIRLRGGLDEAIGELCVELDGDAVSGGVEQALREAAEPGTDLDDG